MWDYISEYSLDVLCVLNTQEVTISQTNIKLQSDIPSIAWLKWSVKNPYLPSLIFITYTFLFKLLCSENMMLQLFLHFGCIVSHSTPFVYVMGNLRNVKGLTVRINYKELPLGDFDAKQNLNLKNIL